MSLSFLVFFSIYPPRSPCFFLLNFFNFVSLFHFHVCIFSSHFFEFHSLPVLFMCQSLFFFSSLSLLIILFSFCRLVSVTLFSYSLSHSPPSCIIISLFSPCPLSRCVVLSLLFSVSFRILLFYFRRYVIQFLTASLNIL